MARKPPIRWRDKDIKEIRRLTKNFNAKITRAERKNLEKANLLPEKLSIPELVSGIKTRQEFKREIKRIERFLKRGSEKIITTPQGFETTEFAFKQVKEETRVANIILAYERKKRGIVKGSGVETEEVNLGLGKRVFKGKDIQSFEEFARVTEKKLFSRFKIEDMERYKRNYLKGILKLGGDKRRRIFTYMGNLDAKELFDLTAGNPKLVIGFMYDEDQSVENRGDTILTELEEILGFSV